jgi:hypothetical protein
MRKVRLLCLSLILCYYFAACAPHKALEGQGYWSQSKISSSSRLCYTFSPPKDNISLQIFHTNGLYQGYLSLHRGQISAQSTTVPITIKVQEKEHTFLTTKHEGGQKLCLPIKALEILLSALQNKESVTLILLGQAAIISPDGFTKQHEKFKASFSPLKEPCTASLHERM